MKKSDLHTARKQEISSRHKEMLGMDVPDNYFTDSKSRIMQGVNSSQKGHSRVFYLKPAFRYAMAAAIMILIGLGIALEYLSDHEDNKSAPGLESVQYTNLQDADILLEILLVPDNDLEGFLDDYMVEGVLVQAELREQELEQVFINSLLVKDSLIDTYIDDQFIDNIIL
jgi:hypothetical protein